jgi:dihydrolipoamide dehydrogenase
MTVAANSHHEVSSGGRSDKPERFDVCVLGAGPGGYAAAMRAHDLGKRVLLIERARVGGAGIHDGALSSKTMWHLSNDYQCATRSDRGYVAGSVELSYSAVMSTVRAAVSERREELVRQLAHLATRNAAGGVVVFVHGMAAFVSPHAVEVSDGSREGRVARFEADNFVVATGSRPRVPSGVAVDGERVLTSDHIERIEDFPKSLVIVGAGVVGCEYATIFANFGRTKISILDRQSRILPFEDEDIAEAIARNFTSQGVRVHGASCLESLRVVDGLVEYVISYSNGQHETFRAERALVSVGRVPNTDALGLDRAGVEVGNGGGLVVTDTRTSTPHIYAVGDVSLDVALVNVAELEGRHAVERMFGLEPRPINYDALSAIMFLKPEVASVGLNELQAKKQGIPYRVAVLSNRLVNRNIAMRATGGFVKLLATRDTRAKILGLRVVGPQASSAIQGIAFLIDQGKHVDDIDRCMHPHPAITEGVQECARILLGRSIHKREAFGPDLLRLGEG